MNKFNPRAGAVLVERYHLVQQLASSGSATLFLARDSMLGESELALKLIHPHLVENTSVEQALKTAVLSARQLSHPNIVRVFDFESPGEGYNFITMEYIRGWNLRKVLDSRAPHSLDFSVALQFFLDIARALAYAHEKKLLHKNLKPENILISREGEIKLSDFSISEALQLEDGRTISGETISSPFYMAPEQFRSEKLSTATDVYALGCIAHELFTGKPPVEGKNYLDLARSHAGELTVLLQKKEGAIPQWVNELIQQCLAREAQDRPSSAEEVVSRIHACDSGTKLRVSAKVMKRQLPLREGSGQIRDRYRWAFVAVCLMLITLALSLYQENTRDFLAPYYLRFESFCGVNVPWFRRLAFTVQEPLSKPDALIMQVHSMVGDLENGRGIISLLQAGADPLYSDENGITAFHLWMEQESSRENWFNEILPYLPLYVADKQGQTLLHVAVIKQKATNVELLLRLKNYVGIYDDRGLTPFHFAVSKQRVDVLEAFFNKPGFYIDQRTTNGQSALMLAADTFTDEQTALKISRMILSQNPALDAQDNQGKTALHYAVQSELTLLVEELLRAGANIDIVDQSGRRPSDYAVENAGAELGKLLKRYTHKNEGAVK